MSSLKPELKQTVKAFFCWWWMCSLSPFQYMGPNNWWILSHAISWQCQWKEQKISGQHASLVCFTREDKIFLAIWRYSLYGVMSYATPSTYSTYHAATLLALATLTAINKVVKGVPWFTYKHIWRTFRDCQAVFKLRRTCLWSYFRPTSCTVWIGIDSYLTFICVV